MGRGEGEEGEEGVSRNSVVDSRQLSAVGVSKCHSIHLAV